MITFGSSWRHAGKQGLIGDAALRCGVILKEGR